MLREAEAGLDEFSGVGVCKGKEDTQPGERGKRPIAEGGVRDNGGIDLAVMGLEYSALSACPQGQNICDL